MKPTRLAKSRSSATIDSNRRAIASRYKSYISKLSEINLFYQDSSKDRAKKTKEDSPS